MKTKILIVEDSFAKFFCMKHLLESQLKVPVVSKDASDAADLLQTIQDIRPSMMLVRPAGGITALLGMLKKRQTNRRNTEITLILTPDLEESWWNEFQGCAAQPTIGSKDTGLTPVTKAA
jgi:hypothetical protein